MKTSPHPLHRDHPAVQLGPVKVTDALGRLLCGRHGDEAVAAGAGTLGIGHDFGSDDLWQRTASVTERLGFAVTGLTHCCLLIWDPLVCTDLAVLAEQGF